MEILDGNFGTCYFCDCREKIKELIQEKRCFDLTITDPPYNNGSRKNIGMNDSDNSREVELYEENELTDEEFKNLITEWYSLNKQISDKIIFTCGKRNLGLYQTLDPIFQDQYGIWIFPNSPVRGTFSHFLSFEPILFSGDFKQKKIFDKDIFQFFINNGFERNLEFWTKKNPLTNPNPNYKCIHPHPKPFELWKNLILSYQPKSLFDPFCGSGITCRIAEMYGIPWISCELNSKYYQDIKWNIRVGQMNRVKKKKTIESFFKV